MTPQGHTADLMASLVYSVLGLQTGKKWVVTVCFPYNYLLTFC